MATVVDTRVVSMNYKGDDFVKGIMESDSQFERFKDRIANSDDILKALDKITDKFSFLGIAGATAVAKLTSKVMDAGKNLYENTLGQIMSGGKARALNIEQAKFQFRGLGMDVEASMASAKEAVLGTAYGLDAAAKAASQLGASGIQAGEGMTDILKGIAGVAAMSNSSFEDISRIFTTAASNGKIMTMQLRQLSSRGLNASAALAKSLGKTEAEINDMVTKGKISFKMFSDAMSQTFGEHAKSANKTFEGSLSNMKAALSRIGANIFTPFLENAKNVFNFITPLIDKFNDALAPAFDIWTKFSRVKFEDEEQLKSMVKDLNAVGVTSESKLEMIRRGVAGITAETNGSYSTVQKLFTELAQTGKIDFDALEKGLSDKGIKKVKELAEFDPNFQDWEKMPFEKLQKQLDSLYEGEKAPAEYFKSLSKEGAVAVQVLADKFGLTTDEIKKMLSAGKIDLDAFASVMDKAFGAKSQDFAGFGKVMLGFSNILEALDPLLRVMVRTFKEIFGVISEGDVASLADGFLAFTEKLKPSEAALERFGNIMRFVFSIGKIVVDWLFALGRAALKLIGALKPIGDLFIDIFSGLGSGASIVDKNATAIEKFSQVIEWLADKLLKVTTWIRDMAHSIGEYLKPVLDSVINSIKSFFAALKGTESGVNKFGDAIRKAFVDIKARVSSFFDTFKNGESGFKGFAEAVKKVFGDIKEKIKIFFDSLKNGEGGIKGFGEAFKAAFGDVSEKVTGFFNNIIDKIKGFIDGIKNGESDVGSFGDTIKKALGGGNFSKIAAGVLGVSGAFAGLSKIFEKGDKVKKFGSLFENFKFGDILTKLPKLPKIFGDTGKSANVMQKLVKPVIILAIAGSLLMLAIAIGKLAVLKPDQLKTGLAGIGAAIVGLVAATKAIVKAVSKGSSENLLSAAAVIAALGAAVTGLSFAVEKLGKLKIKELAKGLSSVSALLKTLSKAVSGMSKTKSKSETLLEASAVIGALALAVDALMFAVEKLGKLKLGGLIKGLSGVNSLLKHLSKAASVVSKTKSQSDSLLEASAVIGALALSVGVLSSSVKKLGGLKFGELIKGLIGVNSLMKHIAKAVKKMSRANKDADNLLGAAAVIGALGGAVGVLSLAVEKLGTVDPTFKLVKGLTAANSLMDHIAKAVKKMSRANKDAENLLEAAAVISALALAVSGLSRTVERLGKVKFGELLKGLVSVDSLINHMGNAVKDISKGNRNANDLLGAVAVISALALAVSGLMLVVEKMGKFKFGELIKGLIGVNSLINHLGSAVSQISKSTKNANDLLSVAAVIAALTAAVGALTIAVEATAKMKWIEIIKGLHATKKMLSQLAHAVKTIVKSKKDTTDLVDVAKVIGAVAAAVGVLALAVKSLGGLKMGDLIKGLIGVSVILSEFSKSIAKIVKSIGNAESLDQVAAVIAAIAAPIGALAISVAELGKLTWGELIKGLIGTVGVIVLLRAMKPTSMFKSAAAMVALSFAVKVMADAIMTLSTLEWKPLWIGMIAFIGGLAAFVGAIALLSKIKPEKMLAVIGVMLATSLAIKVMTDAIMSFANLGWDKLKVGLAGFGIVLASLVASIMLLSMVDPINAISVSVVMLAVAASMLVMAAAMKVMKDVPWQVIAAAGGLLVGTIIALGAAALLLGPTVPLMLGVAGAVTLLGVAVLAVGGGMLLAVKSLQLFMSLGDGATVALQKLILTVVAMVPLMVKVLVGGIVILVTELAKAAPKIIDALLTAFESLLKRLGEFIPRLVDFGFKLILALLKGIADNIQQIVELGADIIVNFINGLASKLGDIIDAGVNLLLSLLQGVSDAIKNNGDRFLKVANEFAKNLAEFIVSAVLNLKDFGKNILDGIKSAILKHKGGMEETGEQMGEALLKGNKKALDIHSPSKKIREIYDNVGTTAKNTLQKHVPIMDIMGGQMGSATTDGMAKGLEGGKSKVKKATKAVVYEITKEFVSSQKLVADAALQLGKVAADNLVAGFDATKLDMSKFMLQYGIMSKEVDAVAKKLNEERAKEFERNRVLAEARAIDDSAKAVVDAEKALWEAKKKANDKARKEAVKENKKTAAQAAQEEVADAEKALADAIAKSKMAQTVQDATLRELVAGIEGITPGAEGAGYEAAASFAYQFSDQVESALQAKQDEMKSAMEGTLVGALTGFGGDKMFDLSFLGVRFSEEFIQGFVEGSKGGVAAVGDVLAGSMNHMADTWVDVGVEASEKMLSAIATAFRMEAMAPFMQTGIKMGAEVTKGFLKGLSKGTTAIFNWIDKVARRFGDQILSAAENALSQISNMAVDFSGMGIDFGADIINWVLDGAQGEFPSIGQLLGGLVGGMGGFADVGKGVADAGISAILSALGVGWLAPFASIGTSLAAGLGKALISGLSKIVPSLYDFLSRSLFRILPESWQNWITDTKDKITNLIKAIFGRPDDPAAKSAEDAELKWIRNHGKQIGVIYLDALEGLGDETKKEKEDLTKGITDWIGAIADALRAFGPVGEFFANILDKISDAIRKVGQWIQNLWEWVTSPLKKAWDGITDFIGALFGIDGADIRDWFKNPLGKIWDFITGFISNISGANGGTIKAWFQGLWEWISSPLSKLWSFITGGAGGSFFEGIKKFGSGIVEWFAKGWNAIGTGTFGEWVTGVWNTVTSGWKRIWSGIFDLGKRVADWFGEGWRAIGTGGFSSWVTSVWNVISGGFNSLWSGFVSLGKSVCNWFHDGFSSLGTGSFSSWVSSVWTVISNGWNNFWSSVSSLGKSVCNWFHDGFNSLGTSSFGSWVSTVYNAISSAISNLWNSFLNLGKNICNAIFEGCNKNTATDTSSIINNIFKGLSNAVSSLWNSMVSLGKTIGEAILNGIKAFLGIKSPSTEGYDVAVWFIKGIAIGAVDHLDEAVDAMETVADAMLTAVTDALDTDNEFTITPVLDLSNVTAGGKKIDDILGKAQPNFGVRSARLANSFAGRQSEGDMVPGGGSSTVYNIKMEQNNTSPKALSAVDIYRQTNSQIATLRRKVGMA